MNLAHLFTIVTPHPHPTPCFFGSDLGTSKPTLSSFFFRVLYGNKITELAAGVFSGLTSLQLL